MTLNDSALFLDACLLDLTLDGKPILLVISCFHFLFKIANDESPMSQK